MKYINDLAYLSHIKQTEQLVKDKKQRNKYRQTELFKGSDNTDENNNDENNTDSDNTNDTNETNINSSNVDGNTKGFKDAYNSAPEKVKEYERREGNDRRKSNQDRGRYVESRQRKNRRHQRELRITI